MTDRLHITDHALLGWMERVHGIDVPLWREMMRAEAEDAVRQHSASAPTTGASFVVSKLGKVTGFVEDRFRSAYLAGDRPLFVARHPGAEPSALPSEDKECLAT